MLAVIVVKTVDGRVVEMKVKSGSRGCGDGSRSDIGVQREKMK